MRFPRIVLSILLLCTALFAATPQLRQIGMVNIPGAPGFGELTFCNGMLLLTHPGASAVDVFDPVKRRVVAQIAGLQAPRGIATDEKDGRVYVADHGSNSIAVIATDSWKVVDSIGLTGSPDSLLYDSAGKLYWTDSDAGTISLLDLHTKQDVARTDTGGTPRELEWDGARKLVFATLQDTHQVIVVDPELKIVNRFTLNASQPTGLVYDPQYHELYVAVRYAVLAISADTGAEIDRVAAPAGIDRMWLDPDSHTLYAASEGSLLTLNAKGRLSLGDEILTQVKGDAVAYDADKHLVLFPGGREGKSKLIIFRPMEPQGQSGSDEPQEAKAR
jgi:YVTN family beta-propeller protein/YD repeat-containing protein